MNIAQVLRFDGTYDEEEWKRVAKHFEVTHLPWLIHAASCSNEFCDKEDCHKFRCMIQHFQNCRKKTTCEYCQVTVEFFYWHAIICKNCSCSVPMCQSFNESFGVESLLCLNHFVSSPKGKRSCIVRNSCRRKIDM